MYRAPPFAPPRARPFARHRVALAAGVFFAALTWASWPAAPLEDRVDRFELMVRAGAGRMAWNEATADEDAWAAFLARLERGAPAAQRLATVLCPVLDTHPGEELLDTLSTALARQQAWAAPVVLACGLDPAEFCASLATPSPDGAAGCLAALQRAQTTGLPR